MVKSSLTQAMRPLANLRTSMVSRSARKFSSTPAYGLKAIFTETDNSSLNEVLNNIQEKIILPSYLPEKQRELIFSPKSRTYIQQNPVIIELDGLEHRFSTIDRFKDVPNSKKALISVLELMKTKEDWDNLGTLLAGYQKAGIRLPQHHYMKMIRKAGRNGQIYSIIECAKQAQKTGFELSQKEHVIQLLTFINNKVTHAGPGDAKSVDALRWTEIVLDLLQRPPHVNESLTALEQTQSHPLVRGQVLFAQASAVQSLKQQEKPAETELAALSDSAQALTSLWSRDLKEGEEIRVLSLISDLRPHQEQNLPKNRGRATLSMSEFVQAVALNIKGMSLAQEIVGDAAKGLAPIEKKLEEHLKEFVESSPKYNEVCADVYEKVTGNRPAWAAPAKPAAEV
ncbi:hypothetical protein G7Z17_g11470 [Cylindrodendrum hubeiense]|uniref:Uncharacterized protein n=1 Tax=Cylindrodendrum hubeiense TaxID=595255 RepID=A0A9P5H0Q3_9HYPO|nr:hypothetical protein G7Z17_g11470 [Cylindrodendrum hubeiense]